MKAKHLLTVAIALVLAFAVSGCGDRKTANAVAEQTPQDTDEDDSTVYGVCGEATTMHTLQLITDTGDTINYNLLDADDNAIDVKGGLLVGDRMAVLKNGKGNDDVPSTVINITTLLGRWSSIDKDFVIEEGGMVKTNVKAERNSWVSWKIHNGRLLLNKDTFDINTLGADSLYLENDKGIYVYTRRKIDPNTSENDK